MRGELLLVVLILSGCVRSTEHVASLPITDSVISPRSGIEIRDCLVRTMDKVRARPVETGAPSDREIAFTGDSGTISVYRLREVSSGVEVTSYRRKMIADRYEEARACFIP